MRICQLRVTIQKSWLTEPIAALNEELDGRAIRLKPHFWLSSEWFSPSGVPGVAIPFYLAHPRLMRLEKKQMLEVEGGTISECMRLLRHETGHALQHGFAIHRSKRFRETFGKSSTPYPRYYRPNRMSKQFVRNLDRWYAQSHPDEDFAETFAVWLDPRSDWRRRYRGWPALRKLEYVDSIMTEIAGKRAPIRSRERVDPASTLRRTLRRYYAEKRERYALESSGRGRKWHAL
jgi:hypothetical protein